MTGATRGLAMFPLGSVLFPGLPLQLRVFEPRYVAMLSTVLRETDHEFGVVLIERGSEVRGGDARFGVGTVARIVSVEPSSGSILLLASGASRFEVVRWPVDVLWTQTGFLGVLKSKIPNPGNTKAAQCAALSLVGPVGLEPTTKGL